MAITNAASSASSSTISFCHSGNLRGRVRVESIAMAA